MAHVSPFILLLGRALPGRNVNSFSSGGGQQALEFPRLSPLFVVFILPKLRTARFSVFDMHRGLMHRNVPSLMGPTRLSKSKSSWLESLWFPSKLPIRNEGRAIVQWKPDTTWFAAPSTRCCVGESSHRSGYWRFPPVVAEQWRRHCVSITTVALTESVDFNGTCASEWESWPSSLSSPKRHVLAPSRTCVHLWLSNFRVRFSCFSFSTKRLERYLLLWTLMS